MINITKFCKTCNEELSLDQFYGNGTTPNGTKKYKPSCKACENSAQAQRYKDIIKDHFGEWKCNRCKFKGEPRQFDCHHIDPSTKVKTISKLRSYGTKLIEELHKCELLCANCHRLTDDY